MKKCSLPKLYAITDAQISGLSHTAQVEKLIAGGAQLVQLRDKHAAARDFFADAAKAVEIARGRGVKIIINDRVDIALAARADGVHLGQTDLPPDAARRILGERAIIGLSTHSAAQAIAAARLPLDYIAVGSIFPTATKAKLEAVLGLDELRRVREILKDFPLVAIGGITAETARAVLDAGADSVAVIGALLTKPDDITAQTERMIQVLNEL